MEFAQSTNLIKPANLQLFWKQWSNRPFLLLKQELFVSLNVELELLLRLILSMGATIELNLSNKILKFQMQSFLGLISSFFLSISQIPKEIENLQSTLWKFIITKEKEELMRMVYIVKWTIWVNTPIVFLWLINTIKFVKWNSRPMDLSRWRNTWLMSNKKFTQLCQDRLVKLSKDSILYWEKIVLQMPFRLPTGNLNQWLDSQWLGLELSVVLLWLKPMQLYLFY